MDEEHRYYVCQGCGHYVTAPEHPDRCENCRDTGWQHVYHEHDDAEADSERVLIAWRAA